MSYHLALELTSDEVRSLKLLATSQDMAIKDLVSRLVKQAIEEKNKKEEEKK